MARGFLCLALSACLLASAQSLINLGGSASGSGSVSGGGDLLGGLLGGLTGGGGVGNVLGGDILGGVLGGANGGLLGGLLGGANGGVLGGLLSGPLALVTPVTGILSEALKNVPLETLLNSLNDVVPGLTNALNVNSITDTVQLTVNSVVEAPFNAVSQLLGSVEDIFGNVQSSLVDVLPVKLPLLDQLSKLPATLKCGVKVAQITIQSGVIAGAADVLKCANNLPQEVPKITGEITKTASETVGFASNVLKNMSNCVQASANSSDITGAVNCIVDPVTKTVSFSTERLGKATPILNNAVQTVVSTVQCAQNAATSRLGKINNVIQNLTNCVNKLGLGVNLPINELPVIGNISAIVDKATLAINNIANLAVGPDSPINKLLDSLKKLKTVTDAVNPTTISSAISTALQSVTEAINKVINSATSGNVNLNCVQAIPAALTEVVSRTVKQVVDCTVGVSQKAATVASQAVNLDIGIKTELASAAAKAVTKCLGNVLGLTSALEKCFSNAIDETVAYVKVQTDNVKALQNGVDALVDEAAKCLANGVNSAKSAADALLEQIKKC